MISRLKKEKSSGSDDVDVAEILLKFTEKSINNVCGIDDTGNANTGAIHINSETMRQVFIRFPEVVLLDCTHKTNRYVYI